VAPRAWLPVCVLALIALCWGLGSYPLLEPDEGRNVEVAREMARSGDYVLPHLDGLPYLDKPATYFAAVAFSLQALGDSEGAARLPSLLFTLGTIALVWRLGRRMGPPGTGEIAGLALATMPLALAFSRTVIFDSLLAFLETLILAAAWRGFTQERERRTWFALAWAAMGLGVITKGPVALVVPLLIVTAFAFGAGVRLRPFFAARAWPWFFVTALPWFVAVSLRRPDFPAYALVYESLKRVATKSAGRTGPIWYFVPVLLAGTFPWIGPAIAAAVRAWRARAGRRDEAGRPAVFLAAWALVPLVFFSLSQSKLPGYYLPALPAVALAAGMLLAEGLRDARALHHARTGTAIVALVSVAIAAALVLFSNAITRPLPLSPLVRNAVPGLVFGLGLSFLGGGIVAFLGARRASVWLMAAGLALPVLGIPFSSGGFLAVMAGDRSSRDLAASIEAAARGARVVGVEAYPTSLRYYLDRPVFLASESAAELTSNYVVSRAAEFHALPGTPLRPAGWWRQALAACSEPTVFVARRGRAPAEELARTLPLIAAGGADASFLAYGPCRPGAPAASGSPDTPRPPAPGAAGEGGPR
jgi:4-amino-4-deoxy-L-arabinose transferase-like glycosyltransferase